MAECSLIRPFTVGSLGSTNLSTDPLTAGVGLLQSIFAYLCLGSLLPLLTLALEADLALTLIQESPEVTGQF